ECVTTGVMDDHWDPELIEPRAEPLAGWLAQVAGPHRPDAAGFFETPDLFQLAAHRGTEQHGQLAPPGDQLLRVDAALLDGLGPDERLLADDLGFLRSGQ